MIWMVWMDGGRVDRREEGDRRRVRLDGLFFFCSWETR